MHEGYAIELRCSSRDSELFAEIRQFYHGAIVAKRRAGAELRDRLEDIFHGALLRGSFEAFVVEEFALCIFGFSDAVSDEH